MGKSSNTTKSGKRSEKGTQSPMIKVFKQIMEKERSDIEKTKLVREKRKKKKSSKSKTELRSDLSSQSQEKGKKHPYKITGVFRQHSNDHNLGDHKESFCIWSKRSTSNSCVTCQLKKMCKSTNLGIPFVAVALVCSIVGGSICLFRSFSMEPYLGSQQPTYTAFRQAKIEKHTNSLPDYRTLDFGRNLRRSISEEPAKNVAGSARYYNLDADENMESRPEINPSFELSNVFDPKQLYDERVSPKMRQFFKKLVETDAQIQNLKKGLYDFNNNQAYDFKKGNQSPYYRLKRSLFRHKKRKKNKKDKTQSVTGGSPVNNTLVLTKVDTLQKVNENNSADENSHAKEDHNKAKDKHKKKDNLKRVRRFKNGTEIPDGIVIEEKKMLIKYLDDKPKFPKCSHAFENDDFDKQSTSRPFLKNSQRLEELLDNLAKPLLPNYDPFPILGVTPKQGNDPFDNDLPNDLIKFLEKVTKTFKNKDSNVNSDISPTESRMPLYKKYINDKSKKESENLRSYFHSGDSSEIEDSTVYDPASSPLYTLSVSTLVTPRYFYSYESPETKPKHQRLSEQEPGRYNSDDQFHNAHLKSPGRKLLQSEDEEDNQEDEMIGYEDFKEVLSDDMATHDENDRPVDMKKRSVNFPVDFKRFFSQNLKQTEVKASPAPYTPPRIPQGVYNPNWKGPLPLYPDEVNAVLNHVKPVVFQMTTENYDDSHTADVEKRDKEDEDDVNLAQAYSDYGVLSDRVPNPKKEEKIDVKNQGVIQKPERLNRDQYISFYNKKSVQHNIKFLDVDDQKDKRKKPNKPVTKGPHCETFGDGFKITYSDKSPSGYNEFMDSVHKHLNIKGSGHRKKIHMKSKKLQELLRKNDYGTSLLPVSVVYPSSKHHAALLYKPGMHRLPIKSEKQKQDETDYLYVNDNVLVTPETSLLSVKAKEHRNKNSSGIDYDYTGNKDYSVNEGFNLKIDTITEQPLNRRKRSVDDYSGSSEALRETRDLVPKLSSSNTTDRVIEVLTINSTEKLNMEKRVNDTKKLMKPSDFLMLLSNWFDTLASMSMDPTKNSTSQKPKGNTTAEKSNTTKEMDYPTYDVDMIDNIGHRSRMLLSIDEKNDRDGNSESGSETVESTVLTENAVTNTTTKSEGERDANTKLDAQGRDKKINENKTVVKRNAVVDSDLIFWNDLYDDDYGVKTELNEYAADKQDSAFVKKTSNWIHEKVRQVSNSLRKKSKEESKKKSDVGNERSKRQDINYNDEDLSVAMPGHHTYDEEDKKDPDLSLLNRQMKDICQEAANAVQMTRNIELREDRENHVASGLMKNLVRLMSELVDYEVERRSCILLPSDLKDFLEWLTTPVPDPRLILSAQHPDYKDELSITNAPPDIPQIDMATTQSSEKEEGHTDARSECLGTIHAVQSLIDEYAQLSDQDKEKMGGIKEYLEGQLEFLNKQLTSIDENYLANMYVKNVVPFRFKRDSSLGDEERRENNLKNGETKPKRSYLKNYYRKHTRTTPNNFESVRISTESPTNKEKSDIIEKEKDNDASVDFDKTAKNKDTNNYEDIEVKTKRNLQDVYYKALADSKKTTLKNMQGRAFETFENTPVVRIVN